MHVCAALKRGFWVSCLQSECEGIKLETKPTLQSPVSLLTVNQRQVYAGLRRIILCQRIGLIGTKPATFVAKMLPLGGPEM